jgi:beta-lactamase regulating signal transducer with metallopeptidase domain
MTLIATVQASTSFLAQLVNPAARALILSVIAGGGLAAFRARSTSLRLFTWTAVLYGALAMPLLQWMLPPLHVPAPTILQAAFVQKDAPIISISNTPVFLAANQLHTEGAKLAPSALNTNRSSRPSSFPADSKPHSQTELAPAAGTPPPSPSFASSIRWDAVAAAIYLAVALIFLMRFCVGVAFSHRLMRSSRRIGDRRLTRKLISRATAAGLVFTPRVAESEFISVPLTIGVMQSAILLPCGWREWDDARLDAVLAHELSHIARRDPLTQRLSLLHRAIFWFSPLAWWLDRHLADLAEQASDEAALSFGADRKDYARTLLGFFEALHAAPGRVWWQGVSIAKSGQAEQRVERILSWKGAVAMSMKKSIAVAVLTLAAPVIYLAAAVHPASPIPPGAEFAQASTPPAPSAAPEAVPAAAPDTQAAPAAPPTASGPVEGIVFSVPALPAVLAAAPAPPRRSAIAAIAPTAPMSPMAAVAPIAPLAPQASRHGYSYHYGFGDDQRFVIVSGKTDSLTMSGTTEDARHVEKLRKQIPGDFIWFQRDEKSYVIRDQATIDRAKAFWAPQEELGKKQQELGKKQEALGKQQQELGAKMEKVRVNVPDLTAELEKLKAELKALSSGATSEQVGHIQSEIGEMQSKIGNIQSQAGDQEGKLGEEMGALGEKQGKLGEQQGELGNRQGELAEQANRQMKQLLDDAITKGIAQPEI